MIKIPTARQFQELDQQTIADEQISSYDLMERAASALTEHITRLWPQRDKAFIVFAGPGNNGGDALAIARLLSDKGYPIEAYLFNISGKLSEDCEKNKHRLSECDRVKFTEVTAQFEPPQLNTGKIVIDGLFGTGLKSPLTGGFASLVKLINHAATNVVSIDIPSGLMCDGSSHSLRDAIVRANHTFTFQMPKLAMLFAENQQFIGHLHVVDINLSARAIAALPAAMSILEEADIRERLRARNPFGHKGSFGHALLIAGKYGMAGAAILAARSCLRSGVGKLTIHTPHINNSILQIAVPEAILDHDVADNIFTTPFDTKPYSALAIGPGIGCAHLTAIAFIEQVKQARIPLIIDADGINILGEHQGWINEVPENSILTPHPGELFRLNQRQTDSFTALTEAQGIARKYHIYVILKGHHTAICTPEGQTYFNMTGNSGMATAGSGDVLTGLLLGLLAQGYTPEAACCTGVYLHGLAGDIAAHELGEDSMLASDLVRHLPDAFLQLRNPSLMNKTIEQ